MRLTEEQIRRLLQIRKTLQKKVEKLRRQLQLYEEILRTIDSVIRSASITTADQVLELKRVEEIARAKCLDVVYHEDHVEIKLKFNIRKDDTQFRKYVKEKYLDKFKHEDLERVREGEIDREYAFDYEVVTREDGMVESIRLWNCDNVRLEKIVRALEYVCKKVAASEQRGQSES